VLIDGDVLCIRDRERKLLAKVERSRNRLYTFKYFFFKHVSVVCASLLVSVKGKTKWGED
jgi:hypothetical protein